MIMVTMEIDFAFGGACNNAMHSCHIIGIPKKKRESNHSDREIHVVQSYFEV